MRSSIVKLFTPRVGSIMSYPVVTISEESSVFEAVERMVSNGIGSLIVVGVEGPKGIFTRHDLMNKVLRRGLDLKNTRVREVMSSPLIGIEANKNLLEAIEKMSVHGISRLAVFDGGRLVGIITLTDIRLKFSKGYFSPRLVLKKFIVDTIAYVTFWSTISAFIQIYVIKLTWSQFIEGSIIGLALTVILGGVFGRYLDALRKKFDV